MSTDHQVEEIGKWKKEGVLGAGGFGYVILWRNKETNETIALKECRLGHDPMMTPKHHSRWKLEVDMMSRLNHQNVITTPNFIQVVMTKDSLPNSFVPPGPYYLPGYTGHCPSYNAIVGQTYGNATHNLIEKRPRTPSGRLLPIPTGPNRILPDPTEEGKDMGIIETRKTGGNLTKDIALGYTGHIPLASYQIGLNFTKSCMKGVVEFEKKNSIYEECLKAAGITRPE